MTENQEIQRLQIEVEKQRQATTTKDACAEIVKYVSEHQDSDKLVNQSKDGSVYMTQTNGGSLCSIM